MSELTIIDRDLNMYHTIQARGHSTSYNECLLRDGHIQNSVKDLRWSALKIMIVFSYFSKKFNLKSLRGF